jgi:hypothetical protein
MWWAIGTWLRSMMCWRPMAWRGKLPMSGWHVWRDKLELLAVSTDQTARSYHSSRMTSSRGRREAEAMAWHMLSSSCLSCCPFDARTWRPRRRQINFSENQGFFWGSDIHPVP